MQIKKEKINIDKLKENEDEFVVLQRDYEKLKEKFYALKKKVENLVEEETKQLKKINKELHKKIKEKEKAENRLRNQLLFAKILLNAMPSPIYYTDDRGYIIGCNNSFLIFFNKQNSEVIGKKENEIFKHKDFIYADKNISSKEKTTSFEISLKNAKGKERNLLVYQNIYKSIKGYSSGVLNIFIDITEQKQMQKKHQIQEEIIARQAKMAEVGEMIGNIAHQWRQPLNTISLLGDDLLDAYEFNELTKEYLSKNVSKIKNQVLFMSDTIDDFRNFLKPNKQKEEFLLVDAIKSSIKINEASLKYHDITISFDYDKDVKTFGLKNEFIQVMLNIIKNAKDELIKKENDKKIKITLSSKNHNAIIEISDNAGGIKESIMDKIFDSYFSTKGDEGTGIGLYMSKKIIQESLDGDIKACNIDNGAKFIITIAEID